jgi:hypothetical protein
MRMQQRRYSMLIQWSDEDQKYIVSLPATALSNAAMPQQALGWYTLYAARPIGPNAA